MKTNLWNLPSTVCALTANNEIINSCGINVIKLSIKATQYPALISWL